MKATLPVSVISKELGMCGQQHFTSTSTIFSGKSSISFSSFCGFMFFSKMSLPSMCVGLSCRTSSSRELSGRARERERGDKRVWGSLVELVAVGNSQGGLERGREEINVCEALL